MLSGRSFPPLTTTSAMNAATMPVPARCIPVTIYAAPKPPRAHPAEATICDIIPAAFLPTACSIPPAHPLHKLDPPLARALPPFRLVPLLAPSRALAPPPPTRTLIPLRPSMPLFLMLHQDSRVRRLPPPEARLPHPLPIQTWTRLPLQRTRMRSMPPDADAPLLYIRRPG
ncbi:hypothetical protein C8R44DRAFT_987617, partial [Mycena epipterygia]